MKNQTGFSTVELLVSLFVAAIFLATGYELYSMIIHDGGESRAQARASNAAYEYLLKTKVNSNKIKNPCDSTKSESNINASAIASGLSNPKIDLVITCPNLAETPAISNIKITLKYKYGSKDKQVVYATYTSA